MFGDVRTTCGLAVVSCGNSGIDAIGLSVASRLGLSTFCHMPKGWRNEDTEAGRELLKVRGARYRELPTESYRYCTWANVYLSDLTLVIDPARS